MQIAIEIYDTDINEMIDAMSGYGLDLTKEQAEDILASDISLAAEISEFGAMDTLVREQTIKSIIHKLGIQNDWPMYGNSEEYKKDFYDKFGQACVSNGYKCENQLA